MKKYFYEFKISFFLILLMQITACSIQKKIPTKEDFKYSIDKPIEGQLHTAKRLKTLMAEKNYEKAINLFSKNQQANIREIQKQGDEMFNYWCLAWALDGQVYEYFCSIIRNGNGMFAFEDGEWKIDEK